MTEDLDCLGDCGGKRGNHLFMCGPCFLRLKGVCQVCGERLRLNNGAWQAHQNRPCPAAGK